MVTGYSKKGETSKRGNPTKKGKLNKTKEDGFQFSVQEHLESSRLNDGDLGIPQSDSNSDRINFDQLKVGQTSD